MDFDELLAELAPMHKAMTTDGDGKIEAAAKEAGADMPPADAGSGDEAGGGDDEVLGKSFAVTMPDGTVQEAFDASELVKSFAVRFEAAETAAAEQGTKLEAAQGDLAKALTVTGKLFDIVKAQGERAKAQDERVKAQDDLIKSLQGDIARIGQQGAGRRAVVTVNERSPVPPTTTAGKPNPEQIMTKAMSLIGNGLGSSDIATIEMSLQRGIDLPPHIAAALGTDA